jgi:hypothetical protein
MLEKNGTITLTEADLEEYTSGCVSKRVQDNWNLTYKELDDIIKAGSYTKL